MSRLVSPPLEEFDRLRTPLTEGEKKVFNVFNEGLTEDWEIYVQPHLNNLRPDFVLLNPHVGVAVFEVKDWDLDAMEYFMEKGKNGVPHLFGRKGGKKFRLENPVDKLRLYKEEIHDLYCPRLKAGTAIACISTGLIFPNASRDRVTSLLGKSIEFNALAQWARLNPLSGVDEVNQGNLGLIFPESARRSSRIMNPDLAKDLRNWLHEPEFSAEQRRPLRLDKRQQEIAFTRTQSGYRRVKGPAGSGKSIVLAARAAQLLSEGKDVLVISYNITLLNYLKDLAVRWPPNKNNVRNGVTWLNFHQWCKRVCLQAGAQNLYKAFWREYFSSNGEMGKGEREEVDETLEEKLPKMVGDVIDNHLAFLSLYDAILVDEGQDLHPCWWNVLRKVRRSDGEMLLVSDTSQDIYETARSWTDEAMEGCGFRGDWFRFEGSYRLPASLLQLLKEFANAFLPEDLRVPPEEVEQTDFLGHVEEPCKLRWVQTGEINAPKVVLEEILNLAPSADPNPLPMPDITFLCGSIKFAVYIIEELEKRNIKVIHTFNPSDYKDARRRKIHFYKGDARIKVTTLHSFKGLETRALVIFLSRKSSSDTALAYTGMSRLKRSKDGSYLTVVCSNPQFNEFGKKWPDYETR
jgi:hypothetical protein